MSDSPRARKRGVRVACAKKCGREATVNTASVAASAWTCPTCAPPSTRDVMRNAVFRWHVREAVNVAPKPPEPVKRPTPARGFRKRKGGEKVYGLRTDPRIVVIKPGGDHEELVVLPKGGETLKPHVPGNMLPNEPLNISVQMLEEAVAEGSGQQTGNLELLSRSLYAKQSVTRAFVNEDGIAFRLPRNRRAEEYLGWSGPSPLFGNVVCLVDFPEDWDIGNAPAGEPGDGYHRRTAII